MTTSASRPLGANQPDSSPFALDVRAVGLFRVLLALVILLDQAVRLGDWHAFHSVFGIVSPADSRAWDGPWSWSVYWLSDNPLWPCLLEVLRLLATAALLFGIRSRLSAFVLFVLLASVAARNPLLLQGGDRVLVAMTFFALFLPLGRWGSLERLWFGHASAGTCRSAATVAYAVQILLVWFMAGILKTGEQWWSTGTAISMALHLEAFVSEFARLWRGWDWLVRPLTFIVLAIECLAPLLALVPNYWCRIIGLLALVALEAGIWLSLEVGLFPLISLVSLVPLFPTRFVELVARWWPVGSGAKGAELVLFFDGGCRFCAFACRLLLSVCGIRGAELREAQSDPVAAGILRNELAWSVTRLRRVRGEEPSAQLDPECRQGWDAVRFVVLHSPRPWLLHALPASGRGDRVYSWIGRNRGAIGAACRMCFGASCAGGEHGPVGRFVVSMALMVVLAWNLTSYPAVRQWRDYRPLVEPLVSMFNLKQYWSMFAPHPYALDTWHVMPAMARDGRRIDLLSGRPLRLDPPRDGPDRYGSYRWRKMITRSVQRGEIQRVFGYFCRTGRWAVMDLWEFSRPNLGVAATADLPYEVELLARWRCTDVNAGVIEEFSAEIDALMNGYHSRAGLDVQGLEVAGDAVAGVLVDVLQRISVPGSPPCTSAGAVSAPVNALSDRLSLGGV